MIMARYSIRIYGPLPVDPAEARPQWGYEVTSRAEAVEQGRLAAEGLAASLGGHVYYDPDIVAPMALYAVILAQGVTIQQNRSWPPGKPRTGLLGLVNVDRGPLWSWVPTGDRPDWLPLQQEAVHE